MQRLLSPELKALPTLKTQDSVRSFVKIQLQNASAYVAAGKAFQASWDHQTEPPFTPSKNDEISGFQTPILKPRASRPKFPSKATVEQQDSCRGETSMGFESHSRQNIKPKVTVSRPPATNETKETKKRRAVESVGDTEEEHRDRLAQRRAKKRAKHDITKPQEDLNALQRNSPNKKPASASKCRTGSKKKKTKLPSGMALLHSFSAANIGQKRLTLQPGGVFNKGKASVNTKVNKKKPMKQVSAINVFSELHFLNSSTKPSDSTVNSQPSHTSRINTGSRSLSSSREPTFISNRKPVQEIEATDSELSALVEHKTKLQNDNISDNVRLEQEERKSEVWDIEKTNGILTSDIASAVSKKANTVVLNTQDAFWNASKDPLASSDLVIPQGSKEIIASSDSSSVCPSHSASQDNTTFPALDIIHTTSRFFPSSCLLHPPGSPKDSTSYVAVDDQHQTVKIVDFEHSGSSRVFSSPASSFSQDQVLHDAESEAFWDAARVSGVSACGSLDSLEKALNSYEVDNYQFNGPQEHLSNIDRHLTNSYDSPVHYSEDGGDRYDELAFLQSDDYFMTEPTAVAEDEAVSHEMFEDEDNLELYLWEEEGYPNHTYGTSIVTTDDTQLCYEQVFSAPDEIDDREWNNSNEFVEEETSSRCFPQDYNTFCDDLVSYGEDVNFPNRPQCETLSDGSEVESEAEAELATHLFAQGHALLFGFAVPQNRRVEDEVAKNMRGHWLPQRL